MIYCLFVAAFLAALSSTLLLQVKGTFVTIIYRDLFQEVPLSFRTQSKSYPQQQPK
jgi:hypothetical protein